MQVSFYYIYIYKYENNGPVYIICALAQKLFPDFNFSNLVRINILGQHSGGLPP
jgi:hypothetical protein